MVQVSKGIGGSLSAIDSKVKELNGLKHEMAGATAEIMVALLPTIKLLIEFLKITVIPVINTIAGWFKGMSPEQQKLIFLS